MSSHFVVIVRRKDSHHNIRSCSGILIDYDRGTVLTSGSLLVGVEGSNQDGRFTTAEQLVEGLTFDIIVKLQSSNKKFPSFLALKCQFRSRWCCHEVQEILQNCMPKHRWSFDIPPDKQRTDPDIDQDSVTTSNLVAENDNDRLKSGYNAISQFIILQIVDTNKKLLKKYVNQLL